MQDTAENNNPSLFPVDPISPEVDDNSIKEIIVFGLISVITLGLLTFSIYIVISKYF